MTPNCQAQSPSKPVLVPCIFRSRTARGCAPLLPVLRPIWVGSEQQWQCTQLRTPTRHWITHTTEEHATAVHAYSRGTFYGVLEANTAQQSIMPRPARTPLAIKPRHYRHTSSHHEGGRASPHLSPPPALPPHLPAAVEANICFDLP